MKQIIKTEEAKTCLVERLPGVLVEYLAWSAALSLMDISFSQDGVTGPSSEFRNFMAQVIFLSKCSIFSRFYMPFFKIHEQGVPIVAQQKRIQLGTMRL